MRHNAIAFGRLIVLSLQAHLHLLVLVAAAWNVTATHLAGASVSTAAVFLVLNAVAFILLATLGAMVWCFKLPIPFLASVKFECGWSAALSIVQLGATIGATADAPPRGSTAAISTSHTLLVPAAWLTTIMALFYVVSLILVVRAHKIAYPDIWSASVYSVDWFLHTEIDAKNMGSDSWTQHLNDIEAAGAKKQPFNLSVAMENAALAQATANVEASTEKAPWAQSIRRGVDSPFASKPELDLPRSITPPPNVDAALPPLPLRVKAKTTAAGSRFVERFRESWLPARTSPFPVGILDHDKPIPVPNGVEWLRADAHVP